MYRILILFVFVLCGLAVKAKEGSNVPSVLKTVTVYRSGAQMVHTASATLVQGNNQLIIENISNKIDVNSIQVKAPATVTILGIEFSGNFLGPVEKSAREKMLNDSLEHVQLETEKVSLSITNTSELLDVLKSNRDIKGSQTGMSVAELVKLMDYYKTKSLELQTDLQQLNNKKKKLDGLADKIENQITEEQKKNTTTAGRLTLQLSAAVEGKADFTISYIAQNAYWTPYYDVRVANINSPLKLVYKAKVVQTTGVDWKQVKLTLATSMPSQWGNAPVLNPWLLAYVNPVTVLEESLQGHASGVVVTGYGTVAKTKDLTGAVAGVNVIDMGSPGAASEIRIRGITTFNNNNPLILVNGARISEEDFRKIEPSAIKSVNVLKDASAAIYGAAGANGVILITLKNGLEDYVSVTDNALNVTFDIDIPYDVPTNGKEQTATLKMIDLPVIYKHYAVPKLDNNAYLLAAIPGWEKLNLLPGDANIILEDTYIGKSFIEPNATTDTLNLTLGRDERVVIKRQKLVDFSSVKFLGSNKLQRFTYEITVKNNKAEAVNLQLKDQFPLSTTKEVEVEMIDNGGAEVNSETGVLNWKLTLAPGETQKVRFEYTIKYPKDKTLNLN